MRSVIQALTAAFDMNNSTWVGFSLFSAVFNPPKEGTSRMNLQEVVNSLLEEYRPSRAPFFSRLSSAPSTVVGSPAFLEQLYTRYQAAMHATRVMVYFLPHLDTPALRTRKLQIYVDDDGLAHGDTHHAQLRRAFVSMGANISEASDQDFGDLDALARRVDAATGGFIKTVQELYARSLGAWCVTENFSEDWLHAFARALGKHFPAIQDQPYFADCFREGIEERHGKESLEITSAILAARPALAKETLADARAMAQALQGLWLSMDALLAVKR